MEEPMSVTLGPGPTMGRPSVQKHASLPSSGGVASDFVKALPAEGPLGAVPRAWRHASRIEGPHHQRDTPSSQSSYISSDNDSGLGMRDISGKRAAESSREVGPVEQVGLRLW